jgi:SH3 domain protein
LPRQKAAQVFALVKPAFSMVWFFLAVPILFKNLKVPRRSCMPKVIFSFLLVFATVLTTPVWAEQRYVSDQLLITLRQGQGEKFKILKMLKTGAPLEVLEDNGDYLRVRTEDGTDGYVLNQYVTDETPKPVVISRLEKENADLKNRLEGLQAKQAEMSRNLGDVSKDRAAAETSMADLKGEVQAIQAKYDDLKEKAANVVQLSTEHDRLKQENSQLAGEVDTLRQKNDKLLYNGAIKWFLAGGGVLLFGWILGRISRNKRKRGFS